VISGFRREVDENCALLSYYAASDDNLLPTFRDNLSVPHLRGSRIIFFGFLTPEDGIDSLYRNIVKKLQLLAA
jgi:hypothetical protein